METCNYALKQLQEHPHTIQYMNNKAGVDKIGAQIEELQSETTYPRETMQTDMDLIMAYQKLRLECPHTVILQHVMGHADKKKKDKPHTITPLEWVNIECDKEAGIVNGSPVPPPVLFKPHSQGTRQCSGWTDSGLQLISENV